MNLISRKDFGMLALKTPNALNKRSELLHRDNTSSASRLGSLTPARTILAHLVDRPGEERGFLQPLSLPLSLLQRNLQKLASVRLDSPVYLLSWLLYRLELQMDSILELLSVPSHPNGKIQICFFLGAYDESETLAVSLSREECQNKDYLDSVERDFQRLAEMPAIWGFEISEIIKLEFTKEGVCRK
jgi:hypothetical protein